jgi:hypothetical protein
MAGDTRKTRSSWGGFPTGSQLWLIAPRLTNCVTSLSTIVFLAVLEQVICSICELPPRSAAAALCLPSWPTTTVLQADVITNLQAGLAIILQANLPQSCKLSLPRPY